ncbi:hypothetical protein Pla163_18880 [Planctomycetes bacterium Pla163]|uniref:DUF4340 domain-containing protein n=1 Tax=Rohdeia mirabilis TaxID=2528008 RepID=A0A518CZX0_9BACT|nr:hypothetical protein Pla163_18880 [Planctomycetes bacterium Pla163]
MHNKKILLLVLAVGLLGFFVSRQMRTNSPLDELGIERIFEGFERRLVDELRIEQVHRGQFITFERGDDGLWRMTEPLERRAEQSTIADILARAVTTPGTPTPGLTREQAGLEPPLAVVQFVEASGTLDERRHRLELGAMDLDQANVHLFADGRILRAPRGLWDAIDRPVDSYREQRLLPDLDAKQVVGIRRHGTLPASIASQVPIEVADGVFSSFDAGGRLDLELEADLIEDRWLVSSPHKMQLDPAAMSIYLQSMLGMRAVRFVDRVPADLRETGLADPFVVLEFVQRGGAVHTLEIGLPGSASAGPAVERPFWFCRVDGDDSVLYEIEAERVRVFCQPFENLMDFGLLHTLRSRITRVEARGPSGAVEVVNDGGTWYVDVAGEPRRADGGLISDWLGDVDRMEFINVLDPAVFFELEITGTITVVTDEVEDRLTLGPRVDVAGVSVRAVRRGSDELWGIVARDLESMTERDPLALLSLRLVGAREADVARVEVSDAFGATRSWVRDPQSSLWGPAGADGLEDKEFARIVDRVLAPVAARWLDEATVGTMDWSTGTDVTIHFTDERTASYRLLESGASVFALWSGLAAELSTRVLFDGLAERLEAPR